MVAESLSPTVYWPSGCAGHCSTLFRQVCGGLAGSTDEAATFWYSSTAAVQLEFLVILGFRGRQKKLSGPLYASA